MSDLLEWSAKIDYVLTELIIFLFTSFILIFISLVSLVVVLMHFKGKNNYSFSVRLLFEMFLPSAIVFTAPPRGERSKLVLIGHQERSQRSNKGTSDGKRRRQLNLATLWVHIYFVLLCGLVMIWAVSVFSDSVLYRKTSSCNDLSLDDTDLSCFLLSTTGVPEGVQRIIDEEGGGLVPCDAVHRYTTTNNITHFDLEVVCYQYQLNPTAAMGIAYGAMKLVTAAILYIFRVIFFLEEKFCKQDIKDESKRKTFKCLNLKSKHQRVLSHIAQLVLSAVLTITFIAVVAVLHVNSNTRNSGFDLLRGETFYPFSMVVLIPITIIYTMGLFPWWAFESLERPPDWDVEGMSKEEMTRRMDCIIYSVIIHHQFSTEFIYKLESGIPLKLDEGSTTKSTNNAQSYTEAEDIC